MRTMTLASKAMVTWIYLTSNHVTTRKRIRGCFYTWKICLFDAISNVFSNLSQQPTLMQVQEAIQTTEKFTVLLYHRTSNCLNTNEYRRELSCHGRSIGNILPTNAALWKHTLWSCYIAEHMWAQSMIKVQTLPTPEDWG